MVRRDGADVRKERIQEFGRRIQALLHKSGGEIPLSKTVSAFAYEFGLTKEKIIEYFEILEHLDRFALDVEGDKVRRASNEERPDE